MTETYSAETPSYMRALSGPILVRDRRRLLTDKQRTFVQLVVEGEAPRLAATKAGYSKPGQHSFDVEVHRLQRHPKIRRAIETAQPIRDRELIRAARAGRALAPNDALRLSRSDSLRDSDRAIIGLRLVEMDSSVRQPLKNSRRRSKKS